MNLEKLKETARKFEQKEEWRKAIDVYLKAIQHVEDGGETSPDLSVYNRTGDLYLRINDTTSAVRYYERAVDLYADQGFFNNAIALCGKILRVNPGRTQTYLKLAQLHARKNVVIEAKRNLIEYLERMSTLGQLDQAFQAVTAFADQFAGSQEIRLMLVELLRASSREDEARVQLEKLAAEQETAGDIDGARRTRDRLRPADQSEDTAAPPEVEPARPAEATPRAGGLVFLDTGFSTAAPSAAAVDPTAGLMPTSEPALADDSTPLAGLESMGMIDMAGDVPASSVEPLAIERVEAAAVDFEGSRLEGMEGTPLELTDDEAGMEAEASLDMIDVAPDMSFDDMALDTVEPMDLELETAAPAATELAFIDTGAGSPARDDDAVLASLEDRVLDDPDNPDLHRDLADALLAADQQDRALAELGLALAGYESREQWAGAGEILDRLLSVSPDSTRHHQKRVELAFRVGERAPLLDAYLGLGDALARTGATEKAVAVFRRVQEHDPGNVRARTALEVLTYEEVPAAPSPLAETARPLGPPVRPAVPSGTAPAAEPVSAPVAAGAAAPTGPDDFVDFGAMVLDEQRPADTRMRVDRGEPTGEDEQREFREILEQFKRGIDENLSADDYDAHYDLGIAFKEMGLLDEAVAEFQRAVRTPVAASRLRASEALGAAFYEKAQYEVTETVLRRALDTADSGDDATIGLLYWLGRAVEAQGKGSEAIAIYERALAVDIRFMDLNERVTRLRAERRR